MQTITREALEKAKAFVAATARPVDQALLAFQLDPRPSNALSAYRALGAFQNADGGFGHGMEPDLRTPRSQAISTSFAFQYLRRLGVDVRHPLVVRGVDYLVQTVDRQRWVWKVIDEGVEEGVHAPWWNLVNLEARFNSFVFNPTAELLGYLYEYSAIVPSDVIAGVQRTVVAALEEPPGNLDAYDVACCVRLQRSPGLPDELRQRLEPYLLAYFESTDGSDEHLDLLQLIPDPGAFGYEAAKEAIARQVSALIERQSADGGWRPFWNWSEVDTCAWHKAEAEWAGILTREAVVCLQNHGATNG